MKDYWILDPRDKTMQVWWNEGTAWRKTSDARLESRLLPGFVVEHGDVL